MELRTETRVADLGHLSSECRSSVEVSLVELHHDRIDLGALGAVAECRDLRNEACRGCGSRRGAA